MGEWKYGSSVPATIEERCFLCGPWREVITRTVGAMIELCSIREALKIEPEGVKLKNLHC
jgi:hypothetical protein